MYYIIHMYYISIIIHIWHTLHALHIIRSLFDNYLIFQFPARSTDSKAVSLCILRMFESQWLNLNTHAWIFSLECQWTSRCLLVAEWDAVKCVHRILISFKVNKRVKQKYYMKLGANQRSNDSTYAHALDGEDHTSSQCLESSDIVD